MTFKTVAVLHRARQSDGPLAHQVIWTDVQEWLRTMQVQPARHSPPIPPHNLFKHLPKHLHSLSKLLAE